MRSISISRLTPWAGPCEIEPKGAAQRCRVVSLSRFQKSSASQPHPGVQQHVGGHEDGPQPPRGGETSLRWAHGWWRGGRCQRHRPHIRQRGHAAPPAATAGRRAVPAHHRPTAADRFSVWSEHRTQSPPQPAFQESISDPVLLRTSQTVTPEHHKQMLEELGEFWHQSDPFPLIFSRLGPELIRNRTNTAAERTAVYHTVQLNLLLKWWFHMWKNSRREAGAGPGPDLDCTHPAGTNFDWNCHPLLCSVFYWRQRKRPCQSKFH